MTEDGGFRTETRKMVDGYLSITGRVKSQFKLENGKYVSPAPLEENLELSPLVEQAVLDDEHEEYLPNRSPIIGCTKNCATLLSFCTC